MDFLEIYDFSLALLNLFADIGQRMINFMSTDFLGYPLMYWLLGAGLTIYLGYKIIGSLVIPD